MHLFMGYTMEYNMLLAYLSPEIHGRWVYKWCSTGRLLVWHTRF
jgi:hypothetical protein